MLQSRAARTLGCLVFSAALGAALGACGGESSAKPPAESANAAHGKAKASSQPEVVEDSSGEASEGSQEPPRSSCDDGTCAPCGDGICPSGWYCDEGAKGGPACGWLPQCAQKPSCACLTRALSGCSCEETQGGLHLSCS